MTLFVCLFSLLVQIVELVADLRISHHCLLVYERLERIHQSHGMPMIRDLGAPVLVMELLVLVSMGEDASLAEDLKWTALSAKAAYLPCGRYPILTFRTDAYPLTVLLHGQQRIKLVILDKDRIFDDSPVNLDIDRLEHL